MKFYSKIIFLISSWIKLSQSCFSGCCSISNTIQAQNIRWFQVKVAAKPASDDISDDDDDDDDDDQITENDLVQVSFEDYDDIISKEVAKINLIQELKSYEACIIQKEEPDYDDEQVLPTQE